MATEILPKGSIKTINENIDTTSEISTLRFIKAWVTAVNCPIFCIFLSSIAELLFK